MPNLKVFVSSPSDVGHEREIARKLLQQLGHEFAYRLKIDAYFWEYEPMDFSLGYQPQIPLASEYDIVICIFHSKLGAPLTVKGVSYPSGTAYELLQARSAKQARIESGEPAKPNILVFVNSTPVMVPAISTPESEKRVADYQALRTFIAENTRDGDEFVGAVNSYKTTTIFADKLESKLRSLIKVKLDSETIEESEHRPTLQWRGGNPFQGLFAFEYENAKNFFGRSNATASVIKTLQNQVAEHRVASVMIVGPSGSGKSSLARAGVQPILVSPGVIEGVGLWRRAIMKPSLVRGDLFASLATSLLAGHALPELSAEGSIEELATRLRSAPEATVEILRGALRLAAEAEVARQKEQLEKQIREFESKGYDNDVQQCRAAIKNGIPRPKAKLTLLIDQFEELYTSKIAPEQIQAFTHCLRVLLESKDSPVVCVITLASAFYPMAMEDSNLREIASGEGTYSLAPPTEDELAQMIRLPALAAGIRFGVQDGVSLDEVILKEARNQPDCLPLLEFCLEELTKECQSDGILTYAAYEKLGRIVGVITNRALETLETLPPESRESLDIVLQALINRDPNQPQVAVRRVATWHEIAPTPESESIVIAFVNARLLVMGIDNNNEGTASVVHEALLRSWEPAKKWIGLDENQDFLRRRERLEQSFRNWTNSNAEVRKEFLLPSGIQLADAQDLLKNHPHAFREMEKFVRASVQRHRRRQYLRTAALAVAIVLSGILYYNYSVQRLNDAIANQLLAKAEHDLLRKDFASAEIAAAKALTLRDNQSARNILIQARSGGLTFISRSDISNGPGGLSTFSRSGDYASSVTKLDSGDDYKIDVFSTKESQPLWSVRVTGLPDCCAFGLESENGLYFAVAREDFTIGVWKLERNKPAQLQCEIKNAEGTDGHYFKRVPSIAFHPKEPWLATCSEDKQLHIWDISTDKPIVIFQKRNSHDTAVHGIAFNVDGSLLASGGGDYLVKVWDVPTGIQAFKQATDAAGKEAHEPIFKLKGHTDSVFAVAFSPDGKRLASGGYDRIIRVWDLSVTTLPISKLANTGANSDQIEELRNAKRVHPILSTLSAHEGTILDLVFSADSKLLLSGSKDRTVRLWDASVGGLLQTMSPECGEIRSVAMTKFDKPLHCGGENGWCIFTGNGRSQLSKLWNGGATIGSLAFDPLGRFIAAGGNDGVVRLWNPQNYLIQELDTLLEGESINALAISNDGRWIAAAGEGKFVHIWDGKNNWKKVTSTDATQPSLEHAGAIWGLSFANDSSWLASSNTDKEMRVKRWDAKNNWSLLDQSPLSDFAIYTLAIHPEDKWIACGDANATIRILDVPSMVFQPKQISTVETGERNVWSLAVCSKPLSIFSGNSNGYVRCWVPGEDQISYSTSGEDSKANRVINSISYNPGLKLIAAGGDGNSVEIYNHELKKQMSLIGHEGIVWFVAFDRSTPRLASGGQDKIIRIWDLDELNRIQHVDSPAQLYLESSKATGLSVIGSAVSKSDNRK